MQNGEMPPDSQGHEIIHPLTNGSCFGHRTNWRTRKPFQALLQVTHTFYEESKCPFDCFLRWHVINVHKAVICARALLSLASRILNTKTSIKLVFQWIPSFCRFLCAARMFLVHVWNMDCFAEHRQYTLPWEWASRLWVVLFFVSSDFHQKKKRPNSTQE